ATAVSLAIVALGGLVAFAGLREIFEVLLPASTAGETEAASDAMRTAGLGAGIVVGVAAVLVVAIAWWGRPPPAPVPAVTDACNGAPELCGRRLDEVVFPATHNSMSAADIPDWLFPQQERGIAGQLEDGVRGLLFDVHYGIPVEGRVKTDLDREGTSREKFEK